MAIAALLITTLFFCDLIATAIACIILSEWLKRNGLLFSNMYI